jgi:hypothetical protein
MRAADKAGQNEDRHEVGKDLDEFNRDGVPAPYRHALEPNLDGIGKPE